MLFMLRIISLWTSAMNYSHVYAIVFLFMLDNNCSPPKVFVLFVPGVK